MVYPTSRAIDSTRVAQSNLTWTNPRQNMQLYLLYYGAGNVASLTNSLQKLGYDFQWTEPTKNFDKATVS